MALESPENEPNPKASSGAIFVILVAIMLLVLLIEWIFGFL